MALEKKQGEIRNPNLFRTYKCLDKDFKQAKKDFTN